MAENSTNSCVLCHGGPTKKRAYRAALWSKETAFFDVCDPCTLKVDANTFRVTFGPGEKPSGVLRDRAIPERRPAPAFAPSTKVVKYDTWSTWDGEP